jgi:hypothetical protein
VHFAATRLNLSNGFDITLQASTEMKKLLLVLFISLSAVCANAQDKLSGFEDLKIGSSTLLRIPIVDGFVHAVPNSDPRTQSFKPRIVGTIELLSYYLSVDDQEAVNTGQSRALNFYAQLSTPVRDEKTGLSPLEFDQFASGNSKGLIQMFDVNGIVKASVLPEIHSKLDDNRNNAPSVGLSELKKLGVFSINKTMVSLLLTQTGTAANGEKVTYLITGSSIYLKNRILFLDIYRRYRTDLDIDILGFLTAKWTAAIIAANK